MTDEASRLEKMCGMDASGECLRRPNGDESVDWTPASGFSGVQNMIGVHNGRHMLTDEASRILEANETDATC